VAQRPILLRCVRRHILSRGCPHRVKSSGIGHGNPSVGFSSESRLIAALPRTAARGSMLWYKTNGTTTVDGTTSLFKGTVTVLGGTGKFEGAKGDGTVTGARLVPLAAGADLYNDLVINLTK
jgi:hypothetical protein